jgi:hypothetical protein
MSGRKSPAADLPCAGDDYHIADPVGHIAFGTAICWLALGLMKHDGVVIGIGACHRSARAQDRNHRGGCGRHRLMG